MKFLWLLLLGFCFISCNKATDSYVAGYWDMESGSIDGVAIQGQFRIQFFKDHTGRWGHSYYTLDSIYWEFDKAQQMIKISEMKSDSTLNLIITEKKSKWMHCVSEAPYDIELFFNRL